MYYAYMYKRNQPNTETRERYIMYSIIHYIRTARVTARVITYKNSYYIIYVIVSSSIYIYLYFS